ncbi:CPBP family intramembrane metalloprotease [Bacillus sp. FJAT-49705]|uniref:CPBP family intramembrane metalloprotease n=1 Tax=Cytobacillus citreus TaxID=2833586 RepID=A0ABS5NX01_9BACI|nr:CPBP family intramembrane glutamic endopeptidase [Cytobacillus citreus]MBS4191954.1 CPBP family intramembrane metalloprotease [Cytobacillus citreus]
MKKNHVYALIIYFGVGLLGDVITLIFNNPRSLVIILNFMLSPLLLFVTLYLLKDDLKLMVFEKRKSTVKQSIYAIIKWFFIVIIGFIVIATITPLFSTSEVSNSSRMTQAVPLIVIPFVFIAPILEELIFRRIIFTSFSKKFTILLSILFTSVIFAGWHMTLSGFPLIFWLSVVITYSYYQTNRLLVPITIHILWNLFSSSVALIGASFFE